MQPVKCYKNTMKPIFIYLYYLENPSISIFEIKRTDLPEDADISIIFHWLMFDKQTLSISKLEFISMDRTENVEERFFAQGYLKFNAQEGTFIEKFNAGQHKLTKIQEDFPTDYQEIIHNYLTSLATKS